MTYPWQNVFEGFVTRRVTCGLEKVNGIHLTKRSGWIVRLGCGGCGAVSQYWNMLACSLVV